MTPPSSAQPPVSKLALHNVLTECARFLSESSEPGPFLAWIAETGPDLAPELAAAAEAKGGPPGAMFRALGVAVYNAMPLPDNGFKPGKLRIPGRNEPCLCGSGRKYKQCCRPPATPPDLRPFNLLRHVLDVLPLTRFPALPGVCTDLEAVAETAYDWLGEGQGARAAALLEPWFAGDGPIPATLGPLFDALMDCYAEQQREHRQDWLTGQLLARGDRTMRAEALRDRSLQHARCNEFEAAWSAFQESRSLDPSNPALAQAELSLLLLQNELTAARKRAQYWIARLQRGDDQAADAIIEFVCDVQLDPEVVRAELRGEPHPRLGDLSRLLDAAPAPAAHYTVTTDENAEPMLEPDPALDEIEEQWSECYGFDKPLLTSLDIDDDGMWRDGAKWLEFLAREPLAWQSFEVIDDLVLAVDVLPRDATADAAIDALLARGSALIEANRSAEPATQSRAYADHWPALRLLARCAYRALEKAGTGDPDDRFIELAERSMALNPADDYRIREPLSGAYLRRGEFERVLALTGDYPEDVSGASLNRLLALLRLEREAEAAELLRASARRHSVAIAMLLEARPRRPPPDLAPGLHDSEAQAWAYRQAHRSLWEQDGALEWLRAAWPHYAPE